MLCCDLKLVLITGALLDGHTHHTRKRVWLLKKIFPGLINQLDHLRIDNINDARALVGHLHPLERELLKAALKEQQNKDKDVVIDGGIYPHKA